MKNLNISLIDPTKLLFLINGSILDFKKNIIINDYIVFINKLEREVLINEFNLNDILLNDLMRLK